MAWALIRSKTSKTSCPDCGRFFLPRETVCYCGYKTDQPDLSPSTMARETFQNFLPVFTFLTPLIFWFPVIGLLVSGVAFYNSRKEQWSANMVRWLFFFSLFLHVLWFSAAIIANTMEMVRSHYR